MRRSLLCLHDMFTRWDGADSQAQDDGLQKLDSLLQLGATGIGVTGLSKEVGLAGPDKWIGVWFSIWSQTVDGGSCHSETMVETIVC